MFVETFFRSVPARLASFDGPRAAPVDRSAVSRAILESSPWEGTGPLALSAGFMLLGAAVLCALWLYRNRDEHPPPQLTYLRLCAGLGLSWGQRLRLWWVSRACGLPTPITLMLCPATFDHHTGAYLARTPPSAAKAARQGLQAIRERLYGAKQQTEN